MEKNSYLTNENVAKKFKSNFELVNYAIKLAENMIHTGRDARVKADTQNRAMLIWEEINQGKDQFDPISTTSVSHSNNERITYGEEERPEQPAAGEKSHNRKGRFNIDEE